MAKLSEQKRPEKRIARLSVCVLLVCIVGGTIYFDALYGLVSAVLNREGSSHGIFIPFFSAYILWTKREELARSSFTTNWWAGAGCLLIAVVLYGVSVNSNYFLVFSIISFLVLTGGLILLLFGTAVFKLTALPLFLLVTMIPLPPAIYAYIAERMRSVTTWGSVLISKSLGVPLYREGYYISLPGVDLHVANSCSGIRYLLSYFSFSLIYAVVFKEGWVGRLIVILSSIPLAIVAGIVRLSTIFVAAHYIHPVMAGERLHIVISWIVFAIFLFGAMAVEQHISARIKTDSQGSGENDS